jgi:hypothetical protein
MHRLLLLERRGEKSNETMHARELDTGRKYLNEVLVYKAQAAPP